MERPLKSPGDSIERAIETLKKQMLTGRARVTKNLGLRVSLIVIAIGVLLASAPLLFEDLFLSQPQCQLQTHPLTRKVVQKGFELIDKMGDAAFIAGLIGIAIDQGSKSRFIRELVEEASPLLIGRHLPDGIRVSLLEAFNAKFVRPLWEIEYEISPIPGITDYIRVTSRVTGIVRNCTTLTQEFVLWAGVDPSPRVSGLGESKITRVAMSPESGGGGFDVVPDNDAIRQPDGSKFTNKSQVIRSGERWKTALETVEDRPIYYSLPLFLGTMVDKAVVSVRCIPKKELSDLLEFQVSTGTGLPLKAEDTTWGKEWTVEGPLLPGQAIVTFWNPQGKN